MRTSPALLPLSGDSLLLRERKCEGRGGSTMRGKGSARRGEGSARGREGSARGREGSAGADPEFCFGVGGGLT